MTSDPTLTPTSNLYQPDEHHLPLPGNSLENLPHATQVLPEAFSVTEPCRQLTGRDGQRPILRSLKTFADLSLGLMLVIARLGA